MQKGQRVGKGALKRDLNHWLVRNLREYRVKMS